MIDKEVLKAIGIVLNFINDAEYALESLDCTKKEWKEFDDAIETLQGVITENMIERINNHD